MQLTSCLQHQEHMKIAAGYSYGSFLGFNSYADSNGNTNTGNGNITVNATGTLPITLTYADGLDHVYP